MNKSTDLALKQKTELSQKYFNRLSLSIYDFVLFRFVSQYLWGISSESLVSRYHQYASKKHLEVGVGTSYLLDKYNPEQFDLTLMDLSKVCLVKSKKRLIRYNPKLIRHNILDNTAEISEKFDSISLNYVMHCVAGDFSTKNVAFKNLKELLNGSGILFGITVLQTEKSNIAARAFMWLLNKVGVFNNTQDRLVDLEAGLKKYFKYVQIIKSSSAVSFYACDNEKVFLSKKLGRWVCARK
jgi:hypothetical protein